MNETSAGAGAQVPNLQVDVKGLFPTPIAAVQLPDAAAINGDLKATILARAASQPSTSHSNLGGWQSTWDFADWSGASGRKMIDTAKAVAVAGRLTKTRHDGAVSFLAAACGPPLSGHGGTNFRRLQPKPLRLEQSPTDNRRREVAHEDAGQRLPNSG